MSRDKKKVDYQENSFKKCKTIDELKTIEDALECIRNIFPLELFKFKIPVIFWRHQLYALIHDFTSVDKKVHQLIEKGVLRYFLMGTTMASNEIALVYTIDYIENIKKVVSGPLLLKFLKIIDSNKNCKFSKQELIEEYSLNELNLKEMVRLGLLILHRNVGTYLLSIPNCGEFSRCLEQGKKSILNIIRKSKYKEILKSSLENRKILFDIELPLNYYLWDLIGSKTIESIKSPTGTILRLK